MPTAHESVCCAEISQVWQKVEDQRPEIQMSCITEYPGFQSNCLDVWVLETAYYAFRQQYGADNHTAHEYVHFFKGWHVTFQYVHSILLNYKNADFHRLLCNPSIAAIAKKRRFFSSDLTEDWFFFLKRPPAEIFETFRFVWLK